MLMQYRSLDVGAAVGEDMQLLTELISLTDERWESRMKLGT